MNVDLSGKVVIVTGAARGIGAAIAEEVAAGGAEGLVLTDRQPFEVELPCPVEIVVTDLMNTDAPKTIAQAARTHFGRIDSLVNAAGVTSRGDFLDATPALWDQVMAINARAPFFLMAEAIADMKARKAPGAIVNIQSINAHCGAPDLAIYSASKGALQTLTKNAANAHMADHIRINAINLGWTATETERELHEVILGKGEGWLAAQGAMQPLGRLINEDDTARLATFLLSEASAPMSGVSMDLSQWVTGAPK
ncbi:MAG: oxidoreductase [Pseudomonadota bacterium]